MIGDPPLVLEPPDDLAIDRGDRGFLAVDSWPWNFGIQLRLELDIVSVTYQAAKEERHGTSRLQGRSDIL